tara:strand:+ start:66 stop:560 length:495 start_codon:yes stop_codon:yes gene_type:complete
MTISIIHLIITTSLQLHSSFPYKHVQPLIQKNIIANYNNKKIPIKYTPIHTILSDGTLHKGIIKPTKLPNNVLIACNEQGMHFFPYYLNSEKNIILYNCIWRGNPSFESKKKITEPVIQWFTTHFTIQMYNIDIHDELAAFKLPVIEKCWLLDFNNENHQITEN